MRPMTEYRVESADEAVTLANDIPSA